MGDWELLSVGGVVDWASGRNSLLGLAYRILERMGML
jgi:hypothetical protein